MASNRTSHLIVHIVAWSFILSPKLHIIISIVSLSHTYHRIDQVILYFMSVHDSYDYSYPILSRHSFCRIITSHRTEVISSNHISHHMSMMSPNRPLYRLFHRTFNRTFHRTFSRFWQSITSVVQGVRIASMGVNWINM